LIKSAIEVVFCVFVLLLTVYFVRHYVFTFTVLRAARHRGKRVVNSNRAFEPTVAILIPARNEARVIGRLLQRSTELAYPREKLQVIVIDDASSDSTGEIADRYASRFPFIKVIHRTEGGGGKSIAMNVGFKNSTGDIVLCVDADYYPQRGMVSRLVSFFSDPVVGAVQGRVVVLNESQNTVTRLVALERIGGYRVDQQAREDLLLTPQFGGTVGGFRRDLLGSLGGWDESMLAEDTDLTFRVRLSGFRVRYAGDVESYEEAVDNWRAYSRQRYRWARGHMQCAFKHSWKVLTSRNLTISEKIDGFLLLNVYFMPIVVLLSFLLGISLVFLGSSSLVGALWLFLPLSLYSFVGNFAPFFEVGIGAYLDGRTRIQWLLPLLFFTFFYNTFICTKALFDLLVSKVLRKNHLVWAKTSHRGSGARCITF